VLSVNFGDVNNRGITQKEEQSTYSNSYTSSPIHSNHPPYRPAEDNDYSSYRKAIAINQLYIGMLFQESRSMKFQPREMPKNPNDLATPTRNRVTSLQTLRPRPVEHQLHRMKLVLERPWLRLV